MAEQRKYWTSEKPAVDEPLPVSGWAVLGFDVMIALLAAAALFFVGVHGIGGVTHRDAVHYRIACIVICTLATVGYGLFTVSLARRDRAGAAGWQGVLTMVAVIVTVVIGVSAFNGPYSDDPRPGQPSRSEPIRSTPPASPTGGRPVCHSGGGCSVDGTPIPGSP